MRAQDIVARVKALPVARQVLEWRYERYFATVENVHLFRGVYASFAAASASAPATKAVGYDEPGAAAMYREGFDQLRGSDYPVLFWLERLLPSARAVFDYGGHVGVKYYAFRKVLAFPPGFVWTVCDVPAVVLAGEALRQQQTAAGLRFVTDFAAAEGHDVLLCSGSLQYIERPLAALLQPLARRPPHLLINTTPFSDRATFFTLNNIGSAFCPYKIQNAGAFIEELQRLGYRLKDRWENPGKRCQIPFHADHDVDGYGGMYFRLDA
ncbi:MAG: TIGR04325 family methyltransferase [Pseudomonadota bacterium]